MPVTHLTETESAGVGTLAKDIVQDLEKLGQQHLKLLKQDLKEDFRKLGEGSRFLGIGGVVFGVGTLLLGMALAEVLIYWGMLRWAAYGLVAVVLTGAGSGLLYSGWLEFKKASPLADKTLETLEEDVQWMKNPK